MLHVKKGEGFKKGPNFGTSVKLVCPHVAAFFENICIALFHLSNGLDHYAAISKSQFGHFSRPSGNG